MNLGKQIRQVRQLRELSQEYLGNETGIGQKGISRIENNKVSPCFNQLEKIADVLKVEISFLLQFNFDQLIKTIAEQRLYETKNTFNGYSPKQKNNNNGKHLNSNSLNSSFKAERQKRK